MLETLANVKNNKIKATNGTEQGVEATARMKKFSNGLGKKRQCKDWVLWILLTDSASLRASACFPQ
jgi:hypothetical protein